MGLRAKSKRCEASGGKYAETHEFSASPCRHVSPATMLARAGSTLWTHAREGTALKRAAGRFSTGPDVPEVAILGLPSPHLQSGPGGMAPGVGEDKILTCRDFTLASCGVSGRGRRMLSGRDLMRGSRAMPDCNSGLSMPCTGNGSSRGAHLALWRRARPERLAGGPLCSSCASATAPPTRKSRSRRKSRNWTASCPYAPAVADISKAMACCLLR